MAAALCLEEDVIGKGNEEEREGMMGVLEQEQDGNDAARACLSSQRKAFRNLFENVCSELRKEEDRDTYSFSLDSTLSVPEKSSWHFRRERAFPRGQLLYGRPHPLTVVTMDDCERRVFLDGAVLIVGDTIQSVSNFKQEWESKLKEKQQPHQEEEEEEEGRKSFALVNLGSSGPRVVLPGLINTHVHTAQQLARGIADDVDLLTWLHQRMWPYESSMSREDHFVSSLLCSLELIRSGVTTFAEAGGPWPEAEAKAVEIAGLRCCLARSTMDCGEGIPENWKESTEECLAKQIELYDVYHEKAEGRIKCWFGLRQILNNSDELILRTREEAEKRETGCHMHVSEITFENNFVKNHRMIENKKEKAPNLHQSDACRGGTVRHLDALSCLYPGLLAAHSVWVDESEIGMLAKEGVKIAHCPAAAMKMLGFCPVEKLLNAGCTVGIGTDGAPSNNRMNLMDEMYLTSLINKGRHAIYTESTSPEALPAETIIEMATVQGAKAVLREDEIGKIERGKKADLFVLDLLSIHTTPCHDLIAGIVSSCRSENIESVLCNGSWIMFDRKTAFDENFLLRMAEKQARKIIHKAEITIPQRFKIVV